MIDKLKENIIGVIVATTITTMIILLGFTKDNIIEAHYQSFHLSNIMFF